MRDKSRSLLDEKEKAGMFIMKKNRRVLFLAYFDAEEYFKKIARRKKRRF